MKGFWSKLITLLDDLQARGFIRGDYHDYLEPADTLEEVIKLLD
jgi:predicted Rossmann-fold nucleotide-binding protein